MSTTTEKLFVGNIGQIIRNDTHLYKGNLKHYFKAVFMHARNLNAPYHNFRHMLHVTWLCHDACMFYDYHYLRKLSQKQMRHLLIAAMFHDFDHTGYTGNDDLNIGLAIRGLRQHITDADRPDFHEICNLIRDTEYPHKNQSNNLPLPNQILRDADISQAFSTAWIQQVVFGLSVETGSTPKKMLEMQESFISSIKLSTEWAKERFDATKQVKIREVRELVELLE